MARYNLSMEMTTIRRILSRKSICLDRQRQRLDPNGNNHPVVSGFFTLHFNKNVSSLSRGKSRFVQSDEAMAKSLSVLEVFLSGELNKLATSGCPSFC